DWKKNISKEYGDLYWKEFRTTPKAYINLAKGKQLWASRFGELTSVRLALPGSLDSSANEKFEAAARRYRAALQKRLGPAGGGVVVSARARQRPLQAGRGGRRFGWLFVGFSSFLIVSALLLVGLLYRLNLDRRASQLGVLFAEGFTRRKVLGLLLGEGGALALVGAVAGGLAAIAYSRLLVRLLQALWPGGVLESFLRPHRTTLSLAAGAAGALAVSLLTIAWVVRGLSKVPPRALLAGQTTEEGATLLQPASRRTVLIAVGAAVVGVALLLVGPWVPGHEAKAG